MTFADQLVELRLRRCWSQEELAEASGVSVRTISNLERAATSPQRGTVRALAEVLGLAAAERAAFEEAVRTAGLAARSSMADTTNLPASLTTIIGRDDEIAAVSRRLRGDRWLVVISGPGGVGKSRLALEVAWRVADQFERADAIDLSALRDRDEALVALAAAVDVAASAPPSVVSVAARIGAASWLLLIDSLEHVPEMTDDLARLAELCPRLRVLVTTRTRPDGAVPLAPLPPDQAVRLLSERIRAVRPGFAVTAQNAAALAALCARLDGLPLAIELAAGHLRDREPAEVEAELRVRATALRADVIDVPRRHRTLRDTVAWSTDRLSEPDRRRFAALGSFRGAVPCSAWEAVLLGAGLEAEGLDATVGRLAAVSLINVDERTARTVTMLDTIREVAEELLADSGFEDRCRSAHAQHLLDLVRSADPVAIESNLDNVRAAVAFAIAHEPSTFDLAVVSSLGEHLITRGRFAEAHRVLSAIATATTDAAARGVALLRAGVAANINGDARSALDLARRATRTADSVGDADLRIASLNLAGGAYKAMGELDAAYRVYLSCLNAATSAGNTRYITVALNNLGTVAHDRGAYADALAHYERSLDLKRDLGDPRAIAVAQVNLANLRRDLGDHAAAREHARAAVGLFRDLLDRYGIAFGLVMLAEAELGLGRLKAAERSAREALEISVEIDHTPCRALAECLLGDLDRRNGRDDSAEAHYLAALEHVMEPIDRARILERLAAVLADRAPVDATALLVQADGIRRRRQYAVPPLDRPLVAATRLRLGLAVGAGAGLVAWTSPAEPGISGIGLA